MIAYWYMLIKTLKSCNNLMIDSKDGTSDTQTRFPIQNINFLTIKTT